MRVRAVDRGAGAYIAGAARFIGAVGPAVAGGAWGHGRVGEHADNFGVAVTPQPADGVVVVRFRPHSIRGHRSDATVVERARGGWVVPAADPTPYLDRVVCLVEPHARDLDAVLEQGPGRPERALTPSLLQRLVAADQNDATPHSCLSHALGSISAETSA